MNKIYLDFITRELSVALWQVENCMELLKEGATIPFISRYRKERTGGLDEVQVAEVRHFFNLFNEMDKRKEAILKSIEEQEKLTPELRKEIEECIDSNRLEDIYLPFRPKRRTRASIAREKGLEKLALSILNLEIKDCEAEAGKYTSEEVPDTEAALAGARDIIAETISETPAIRESLRNQFTKYGKIVTKQQRGLTREDEEASKYRNYFDFSAGIHNIPSHRLLALLRGANEGHLSIKLEVDSSYSENIIAKSIFGNRKDFARASKEQVEIALADAYKRLLHPSIENEAFKIAKEKADREAVKVFGDNLTALLLAAPVGQKRVLAIDPGFRTGCKVVCLDAQGELIHNDTIYPHPPVNEKVQAIKKISNLIEAYKIEVIAIGDGTASRETEGFIKKIPMPAGIRVFSVSEDGASVYSASAVAREEFPDYDVTVRGAVSIGRRVMDPLAELVKIDPKSMGVGQYQHDIDQNLLKETLDNTVVSCVNKVGVNLNTASKHLLSYVSGVGPAIAKNIVDYRAQNGPFRSKTDLLNVKRLGSKVFEQSAGFLRIPDGDNPLDNTAVHPERYGLVEKMARDLNKNVTDLIVDGEIRSKINISRYVSEDVGEPTLKDIMEELAKPGLDPRKSAKVMEFSADIHTIDDLKPGMVLPGLVTNITNFGVFVDVGIKQDGLIHISQLADRFVANPSEIVKLHEHIKVKVLDVDLKRGRIQLTLRGM
ncbi:Protein YhgF [bioreactor metagenome]|uniref:Protein YhgF n=1 Tax=bioreactor metagenome TaxID=1076179 RepID=A0A644XG28_9ZZZZ|nr:Tex family protein [Rikenellaceae bacterium]